MLLLVALLTACTETSSGSNCAGWRAIRLDAQSIDGLTDRDAEAILAHNIRGQRGGCW